MIYFEAFRKDGSAILGNLDGQSAVLRSVKDYRKTSHYKYLKGNDRPRYARVAEWRVTCYPLGAVGKSRVLEVIRNHLCEEN